MTDVRAEVYKRTSDARVRQAMLLGALLEGGSWTGPWATGDHGTSGGPFQIHWTVHPDVVTEARRRGVTPEALVNDPAYATSYMLPEYSAAAAKVGSAMWAGNPEGAAERTAYLAERPARDYYATRGADTVHSLYQRAAAGTGDVAIPAPSTNGAQPPSGQQDTASTDPSSSTPSRTGVVHVKIPIPGLPDINFDLPWLRMLLGVLGLVLIVLGLRTLLASAGISLPGPAAAAAGA